MLTLLNIITITNLLFSVSYLFLNDEFAIAISLSIVFLYLLTVLRRFTLYSFFTLSDFIYFNFYILLFLNKSINIYKRSYIKNLFINIYFINISSFIILVKQLFFKRIININFLFFSNRIIKNFLLFSNICNIINIIKNFSLLNCSSLINSNMISLLKPFILFINFYNSLFQKSINKINFFYVS